MIVKKTFMAKVLVTAVGEEVEDVEGELAKQLLEWEMQANSINRHSYRGKKSTVLVGIRLHLGDEASNSCNPEG